VKRRQKAGFLSLRSSKITSTKKKERRRGEISDGFSLRFYNSYFGETQKVYLAITLSKIRPDIDSFHCHATKNNNDILTESFLIRW